MKPHPRELSQRWLSVAKTHISKEVSIHCSNAPAEELLLQADAVIGMTTMVLLEAYLLRIPIVSIQIDRTCIFNPLVEDITKPVVLANDLKNILRSLIGTCHVDSEIHPRFQAFLDCGDQRFVEAIEDLIQ